MLNFWTGHSPFKLFLEVEIQKFEKVLVDTGSQFEARAILVFMLEIPLQY